MDAAPTSAAHQDRLHQKLRQEEAARIRELEVKAAREKALAALKKKQEDEEEERKKREEAQGHRYACGSHFISNDQLGAAKATARKLAQKKASDNTANEQLMRQREAAREEALAKPKQQQEETRRREETRVQQTLWEMDVCAGGIRWIKLSQGYRCGCGFHFISNDQLELRVVEAAAQKLAQKAKDNAANEQLLRQREAAREGALALLKKKQEAARRKREEVHFEVQKLVRQREATLQENLAELRKQDEAKRKREVLLRQREAAQEEALAKLKKQEEEETKRREEAQVQPNLLQMAEHCYYAITKWWSS